MHRCIRGRADGPHGPGAGRRPRGQGRDGNAGRRVRLRVLRQEGGPERLPRVAREAFAEAERRHGGAGAPAVLDAQRHDHRREGRPEEEAGRDTERPAEDGADCPPPSRRSWRSAARTRPASRARSRPCGFSMQGDPADRVGEEGRRRRHQAGRGDATRPGGRPCRRARTRSTSRAHNVDADPICAQPALHHATRRARAAARSRCRPAPSPRRPRELSAVEVDSTGKTLTVVLPIPLFAAALHGDRSRRTSRT